MNRPTSLQEVMEQMRICFTRHGESQANLLHVISNRHLPHALTAKGRAQAEALADRLQGMPVVRIYSSPVPRAVETGVLLSDRLGVEMEVADALREYDCGIMEGRSDEVAWQAWQELFDAWVVRQEWERRIEGGESFLEVRLRFESFIARLVEQYGDTSADVVCVSHGGIYRLMLPLVVKGMYAERLVCNGLEYAACTLVEVRSSGLFCV